MGLACLLALTLWVAPAPAQVIGGTFYSSFGANSGGTFPASAFAPNYWCVTGTVSMACGPSMVRQIAAPFKPTVTAGVQSISLALGFGGSGSNGAIIALAQDAGGSGAM